MTLTCIHGKFDTSTRRGKATVDGNKVYVSVSNFINYANAKGFFCYEHDSDVQVNNTQTVTTSTYTRYVNTSSKNLNVRNVPNGTIVGNLSKGTAVTVYETNGSWSRIGTNRWVSSNYLVSYVPTVQNLNNTVGQIKKLSRACTLYSNSNLTGTSYNYKANTTITVLTNISTTVDKIKVNQTARIAYIDISNYSNYTRNNSTVNKTRKLKACTLYSKSNLTGIKYQYKNNTSITILQSVNSYIDKIKVNATGRIAYVNVNNYK